MTNEVHIVGNVTYSVLMEKDLHPSEQDIIKKYTEFDRQPELKKYLGGIGKLQRHVTEDNISKSMVIGSDLGVTGFFQFLIILGATWIFKDRYEITEAFINVPAPKPKKSTPKLLKNRISKLVKLVEKFIKNQSEIWKLSSRLYPNFAFGLFEPDEITVDWHSPAPVARILEDIRLRTSYPVTGDYDVRRVDLEITRIRNDLAFTPNLIEEAIQELEIRRVHES